MLTREQNLMEKFEQNGKFWCDYKSYLMSFLVSLAYISVHLLCLMAPQSMRISKSTPTNSAFKFFLLVAHFFHKSLYNLGLRFDFGFECLNSVNKIIFCHFLLKFSNFLKF